MLHTRKTVYPLAFFLPLLLLLLIYAHLGIAPFGSNTMVYSDASGQYISYFSLYQDILAGQADWRYSFSKLLGGSLSGLFAYYLASPLNLIFALFPKAELPLAMNCLHLLKISLCGLTMAIYLYESRGLKLRGLLLSTAYAFCGYNLAYGWCTMWIDGVALLPLICLGIDRLWQHGSPFLYIFSLALGIIACFYTGYMLCLFSVLYFFCLLLSEPEKLRARPLSSLIRYGSSSLLAGGLSACVLIPGFLALSGGVPVSFYGSVSRFTYPMALRILRWVLPGAENPDRFVVPCLLAVVCLFCIVIFLLIRLLLSDRPMAKRMPGILLCLGFFTVWYFLIEYPVQLEIGNSERTILGKFLIGYVPFKEFYNGSPNVYIGSLAFMLALCFAGCRQIPVRRRASVLLLILILFFSVCYYLPNTVWHGFEKNNCFNYRYSFVLSFVLIMMAADVLACPASVSRVCVISAVIFCFGVLLLQILRPYRFTDHKALMLSSVFLVLSSLTLFFWHSGRRGSLAALFLVELSALALTADMSLAEHSREHSVRLDEFRSMFSAEQARIDSVKEYDAGFYRLRRNGALYSYNDPMLFNYPGLVHFSSSEKLDTIHFLRDMGQQTLSPYWANGDGGESRALDALLGVRYYLGETVPGYETVLSGVQQNPYSLPLAFSASEDALQECAFGAEIPYNLNTVFSRLCGREIEIFYPCPLLRGTPETASEDPLYLYNPDGRIDKIEVWSRDGEMIDKFRNLSRSQFALLNSFENDAALQFRFVDNDGEYMEDLGSAMLFRESTSALDEAAGTLRSVPVITDIVRPSRIELSISSPDDRLVVLTLPSDEGWTVTLDGEKTPGCKALDLLLTIPVDAGAHQIICEYTAPGQNLGTALSVVSLCLSLVWFILHLRGTRNRPAPEKTSLI